MEDQQGFTSTPAEMLSNLSLEAMTSATPDVTLPRKSTAPLVVASNHFYQGSSFWAGLSLLTHMLSFQALSQPTR